jgi:hypothetical protein
MVGDQLPDEDQIGAGDRSTAIGDYGIHGRQRSNRPIGTQDDFPIF